MTKMQTSAYPPPKKRIKKSWNYTVNGVDSLPQKPDHISEQTLHLAQF